jgi:hypothetical protein
MLEKTWRKRNTPPLLLGLQCGTTSLEINLEVPQKTGNRSTGRPNSTTLGHISKKKKKRHTISQEQVLHYAHTRLICNCQKLETIQMSFNGIMDTENVVHLHNVILLNY